MKIKTKQLKGILYFSILSISILLFSCKKETIEPEAIVPVVPAAGSFTWQENGGSASTADSAFWTTGNWGTGILAYKGSDFFEINWNTPNDISAGIKALTTPYGFTFLKSSATYTCSNNENLSITASASNLISGNSSLQVSGGAITTIALTFTSLPLRP
jgi:hypothetical protein